MFPTVGSFFCRVPPENWPWVNIWRSYRLYKTQSIAFAVATNCKKEYQWALLVTLRDNPGRRAHLFLFLCMWLHPALPAGLRNYSFSFWVWCWLTSLYHQLTLGTALYEDRLCFQKLPTSWGPPPSNDWSMQADKDLTSLSQLGIFLKERSAQLQSSPC